MWVDVSLSTSFLLSIFLAFSFVFSLYLWRRSTSDDRDDPHVIKQRLISVTSICFIAPVVILLVAKDDTASKSGPPFLTWIGFPSSGLIAALILPLLLTASLFLGPLVFLYLSHSSLLSHWLSVAKHIQSDEKVRLIAIRNWLGAPACEEFIYRTCICSLLLAGGWSLSASMLFSPLLFSVAHLHHLIGLVRAKGLTLYDGIITVTLQLVYTSLFGLYASYIYLHTGHFISPFLSHAFCNMMEVPDMSWLHSHHPLYHRRYWIGTAFVIGIILFIVGLPYLTDDRLYNGWISKIIEEQKRIAIDGIVGPAVAAL